MNDLFKNFKIQPTKLRGENMEIKQKALDGVNEITYNTKTGITTTLVHTYRPCIDLYDGDEHIAHYETDKEFIEDFKKMKQENKQLKGSLQTYEVSVKSNVDAIKNKNILDELEKWLIDIKEGIEELTISFQEWGHSAKPSIVINDVLNKLQELKGDSNE